MEVLRTEVSHLGECDPERDDNSDSANQRRVIRLIAKVPTIISFLYRIRTKKNLVVPVKEFSFVENFLYMFRGKAADQEEKNAMERYMILHADHGLNASTFAARVTAGTGSDLYSAVTSAVGTLKGPFHGGASERAMKMLYEINSLDEVEAKKSAGPATAVVVVISKNALSKLSGLINKPIQEIGSFYR